MLSDLRYALRSLGRTPSFTIVVVSVLAMGIGASTTIFSAVNGVLLRPLPYEDPAQLYVVYSHQRMRSITRAAVSVPDLESWRQAAPSFEGIAGYLNSTVTLTAAREAERLRGALVTSDFFRVMRARPVLGRGFVGEEWRPGGPRVVVLGDALWRRRFGADPAVVGRPVTIDNQTYTVVGVMPAGFDFPGADAWAPLQFPPEVATRQERGLGAVARLRPDARFDVARRQLDDASRRLAREFPASNAGWGVTVVPLHADLAAEFRPGLLLLLAAVGFVLAIACANVANLMLARAAARRREMAVRLALGASRWHLVRQWVTESAVLALAGGALGVLGALWGVRALAAAVPVEIPSWIHLAVDGRVLAFATAVSALAALLFGLAPALRASRSGRRRGGWMQASLHESLREGRRAGEGSVHRSRLRGALVVAEVALSLVLLVGAMLLAKSLVGLYRSDPGFDPRGVLAARVALPEATYPEARQHAFYDELLRRVRALPGVRSAGAAMAPPLNDFNVYTAFTPEGQPAPPGEAPHAHRNTVAGDYFRAMRIPLAAGRGFTDRDAVGAPRVAIISETFARHYWPGGAVGKRFKLGQADADESWVTVVGVVRDVKQFGVREGTTDAFYLPSAQSPSRAMTVVLRADCRPAGRCNPGTLAARLRREVTALDPGLAVFNVSLMTEMLARSVWEPWLYTFLLGAFAAAALLLAAVGLYGVIAYAVTQRTHEIGVRVALGARRRDVLRLVVGGGLALALVGIAVGAAGALALTRLLRGMLFGVSTHDPATFLGVPLLLAAVALVASWVPARRAARVDPVVALRSD